MNTIKVSPETAAYFWRKHFGGAVPQGIAYYIASGIEYAPTVCGVYAVAGDDGLTALVVIGKRERKQEAA
jgi:hypothetical protein